MNSLKKEINSFRAAIKGVADFFKNHRHARFHLLASVVVIGAGFIFHLSKNEWWVVLGCIALVMSMEAMNTSLEYLTDLVSPDFHPLAGKAKDMAAGAVLMASIFAATIGGMVFLPKILAFFHF